LIIRDGGVGMEIIAKGACTQEFGEEAVKLATEGVLFVYEAGESVVIAGIDDGELGQGIQSRQAWGSWQVTAAAE
jgi:hypothetical protein